MKQSKLVYIFFITLFIYPILILQCHFSQKTPQLTSSNIFPKKVNVAVANSKVRLSPYIYSSILDYLDEDTKVIVLKRSINRNRVSKYNSYWYLIQTETGLKGWTYGVNLSKEY